MSDDKTITDYIHNQPPIYQLQAMGPIATLRDQFAMAALGGINVKNFQPRDIAEMAYELADAMMEARK
ncbi:MAG: hypothetical protein AMJ56_00565 [Anaerolineae bacterium SG8_19]|nr:MAG: hypothetical protein AMJ56_00565 [Anaerolineae bacterium SG8_19]